MVRDEWLQRFETAMHSLPDRQRLYSTLPRLQHYRQPEKPLRAEPLGSTECFHSAEQEAKIGPDKDIPHVTAPIVVKSLWLNYLVTRCNSRLVVTVRV